MTTVQPDHFAESAAIAEWVGAIGSLLGAVGTLAAVIFAMHLAGRDGKRIEVERREAAEDRAAFRKREEERAEREFRDQASRVSLINLGSTLDRRSGGTFVDLVVRNDSSQLVSWVVLLDRRATFPDGQLQGEVVRVDNWRTIEPGGERRARVLSPRGTGNHFELQFNDVTRQRWQLLDLGDLHAIEPGHPDYSSELSFVASGSDE